MIRAFCVRSFIKIRIISLIFEKIPGLRFFFECHIQLCFCLQSLKYVGCRSSIFLLSKRNIMSILTLMVIKNGRTLNQSLDAKGKAQILGML